MAKRLPVKELAELSAEAQQLYRHIRRELGLKGQAALSLLLSAARSLDRLREAETALARDGGVYTDRFGQPKLSPNARLVAVESNTLQKHLRALNAYQSHNGFRVFRSSKRTRT